MKVLGVEVPPSNEEREPVLDVPAVDMTDAASTDSGRSVKGKKSDTPKTKRRASRGPARRRVAAGSKTAEQAKAKPAEAPKARRDGSVGRETVEAVEALVSQGMKKTEAFKKVAETTGRSAGTIATTYYRLAEKQAGTRGRRSTSTASPTGTRGRRSTSTASSTGTRGRRNTSTASPTESARHRRSTGRGRSSAGNDADVQRLAEQLVRSVSELASAFKAQSEEVAQLRRRLEGVRDLVG